MADIFCKRYGQEAGFEILDPNDAAIVGTNFYAASAMANMSAVMYRYNKKKLGPIILAKKLGPVFLADRVFFWHNLDTVIHEYEGLFFETNYRVFVIRIDVNVALAVIYRISENEEFIAGTTGRNMLNASILGYGTQMALNNILLGPRSAVNAGRQVLDTMASDKERIQWFHDHKSLSRLLAPWRVFGHVAALSVDDTGDDNGSSCGEDSICYEVTMVDKQFGQAVF